MAGRAGAILPIALGVVLARWGGVLVACARDALAVSGAVCGGPRREVVKARAAVEATQQGRDSRQQ